MRNNIALAVLAVAFFAMPAAYAEEMAEPAAPAPTSVPAPAVQSVDGSITSLDVLSTAPWIKLKDANGAESMIYLDAVSTTVWKANQAGKLTQLKEGDKVKVRTMKKDAKDFAKSIEIAS